MSEDRVKVTVGRVKAARAKVDKALGTLMVAEALLAEMLRGKNTEASNVLRALAEIQVDVQQVVVSVGEQQAALGIVLDEVDNIL